MRLTFTGVDDGTDRATSFTFLDSIRTQGRFDLQKVERIAETAQTMNALEDTA